MDQFERQFENLDVQSDVMERAMGNSATLTTPTDQVDALLQEARSPTAGCRGDPSSHRPPSLQVAAQHSLEEKLNMPSAAGQPVAVAAAAAAPAAETSDDANLSRRLAELMRK